MKHTLKLEKVNSEYQDLIEKYREKAEIWSVQLGEIEGRTDEIVDRSYILDGIKDQSNDLSVEMDQDESMSDADGS
jgi:hypothetical protein